MSVWDLCQVAWLIFELLHTGWVRRLSCLAHCRCVFHSAVVQCGAAAFVPCHTHVWHYNTPHTTAAKCRLTSPQRRKKVAFNRTWHSQHFTHILCLNVFFFLSILTSVWAEAKARSGCLPGVPLTLRSTAGLSSSSPCEVGDSHVNLAFLCDAYLPLVEKKSLTGHNEQEEMFQTHRKRISPKMAVSCLYC